MTRHKETDQRVVTMADDVEKAIIYAFDQSGAVAADLREHAVTYLRELQVRRSSTPLSLAPVRREVTRNPPTADASDGPLLAPL